MILLMMEGDVYTDEACELHWVLVNAGCSQSRPSGWYHWWSIGSSWNLCHWAKDEQQNCQASNFGRRSHGWYTSRPWDCKGQQFDCEQWWDNTQEYQLWVKVLAPIYESNEAAAVVHQSCLVGVDSAPDHSSQTQLDGWKSKIMEKLDIYNQSPLAQHSQTALRLADFLHAFREWMVIMLKTRRSLQHSSKR